MLLLVNGGVAIVLKALDGQMAPCASLQLHALKCSHALAWERSHRYYPCLFPY